MSVNMGLRNTKIHVISYNFYFYETGMLYLKLFYNHVFTIIFGVKFTLQFQFYFEIGLIKRGTSGVLFVFFLYSQTR